MREVIDRWLLGSPEAISRHLDRFSESWNETDMQNQTITLLNFAYQYKMHDLLPGIYYLILSVYNRIPLSGALRIPAVDRIRCLTALPVLLMNVAGTSYNLKCDYTTDGFREFSSLTRNHQNQIWEHLPQIFQLGRWDELRRGIISTAVA